MPEVASETILILGGTREAAELADRLVADHKHWRIITSLAGRTENPSLVAGETRVGGFGGAKGMAKFIKREGVTRLIDATHPFAKHISENAVRAANQTFIPLEVLNRAPWRPLPGDNWIEVTSLEEARDAIPAKARVLLALGSQYIGVFESRDDVFFLVRMIDHPATPLALPKHKLLLGKPSSSPEAEADILRTNKITHIVSRNSGGKGAVAKIAAARSLNLPIIMIGQA